ncbi:MAG TPA: acyl-CoA dehydrogenase family protein [Gemmataceae bacterium]|nr:acyl-CoA dehydrogenase family protein [Gemmataceae bacterium]
MSAKDPPLLAVLEELATRASQADAEPRWPAASWEAVRRGGALGWAIPREYGGAGLAYLDLLADYEALAGACLTSCFILSQRDAACRRLRDSGNETLCRELLPPLARGERFATVGLSQLTTSRQHIAPSLVARETPAGLVLDGTIPWVTGAGNADHLIIGAVLDDGRQVLTVLPADLPGVRVGPPLDLMALQGSMTAEVRCDQAVIDRRWLLAGPAERVVQSGRGGPGGLETSCLALGLAGAALAHLRKEAETRPQLALDSERLQQLHAALRQDMRELAEGKQPAERAVELRARANTLVLGATQAALTASKGSGFIRSHPAQRWTRQALFFLVWSCPWPAAAATLAQMASGLEPPTCL